MTRNTRLFSIKCKIKGKDQQVWYRELTILELAFLENIKTDAIRIETAGKIALYNQDPSTIPWPILCRIGEDIIKRSSMLEQDTQLLEIYVKEYRNNITKDDSLQLIKYILQCLPGQSFTELIKLTYKDLVELTCLCESLIGKNIFTFGKKGGLVNTQELPDKGRSLQKKMDAITPQIPK